MFDFWTPLRLVFVSVDSPAGPSAGQKRMSTSSLRSNRLPRLGADSVDSTYHIARGLDRGSRSAISGTHTSSEVLPALEAPASGFMFSLENRSSVVSAVRESLSQSVKPKSSVQEDGSLPRGWVMARHSKTGRSYYFHEESLQSTWERPLRGREPFEKYKLKPAHRALVGQLPSEKMEALPSPTGFIKPSDVARAVEGVVLSELELATKLRTIGPALYLAKALFDRTMRWFDRWRVFAQETIRDREERYNRKITLVQAQMRGWLQRGRADRLRALRKRQARMNIRSIRAEMRDFGQMITEKTESKDFVEWWEAWMDTCYRTNFASVLGWRRYIKKKKNKTERHRD